MMKKEFRKVLKMPQRANLDPLISFENSPGRKQDKIRESSLKNKHRDVEKTKIGGKKVVPETHMYPSSVIT